MKSTHYNELPHGNCPNCNHNFYIDAYFELNEGSTIECPRCHAEIELSDEETVTTFTFTVKEKVDELPKVR